MAVWSKRLWQGLKKTGKNPTDRGKIGTKRSILTDGRGVPLAIVLAGANRPDHTLLEQTLDAVIVPRPSPKRVEQHLLGDKDYTGAPARKVAKEHGYIAHIRQRENELIKIPRRPGRRKARRWVVEQTFGNINRARAILIRWAKEPDNYEAFLHIAAALLCFRRTKRKNP
jgi:putative transposase